MGVELLQFYVKKIWWKEWYSKEWDVQLSGERAFSTEGIVCAKSVQKLWDQYGLSRVSEERVVGDKVREMYRETESYKVLLVIMTILIFTLKEMENHWKNHASFSVLFLHSCVFRKVFHYWVNAFPCWSPLVPCDTNRIRLDPLVSDSLWDIYLGYPLNILVSFHLCLVSCFFGLLGILIRLTWAKPRLAPVVVDTS